MERKEKNKKAKVIAGGVLFLIACLGIAAGVGKVEAQANEQITIQGKIVNKGDGTNVNDTTLDCVVNGASNDTCDFRVSIYDDEIETTLLWEEIHTNVEIENYNGVFTLELNSVCQTWNPGGSPPSGCTASPTVA